jgi:hypothetical protein
MLDSLKELIILMKSIKALHLPSSKGEARMAESFSIEISLKNSTYIDQLEPGLGYRLIFSHSHVGHAGVVTNMRRMTVSVDPRDEFPIGKANKRER